MFNDWATIVDCGDVTLTWLDNNVAFKQLDKAHKIVSGRPAANSTVSPKPRILALGGDHSTTLPALRSTFEHWGEVSVIHFDSHIGILKLLTQYFPPQTTMANNKQTLGTPMYSVSQSQPEMKSPQGI